MRFQQKWFAPAGRKPTDLLFLLPVFVLIATCIYWTWTPTTSRAVAADWMSTWRLQRSGTLHTMQADRGLLVVNATASGAWHPITDLIALGEQVWRDKLARQSRTLQEAYDEYVRRYKRRPPRGFDKWDWCQEHRVQLLDEYDQINTDMEFFWAIRPSELVNAQRDLESSSDLYTHTIGKNSTNDRIKSLSWQGGNSDSRAKHQIEMLKPVSKHLPPFRATWFAHDDAFLFTSWEMKEAARQALAKGEYVDLASVPDAPALWSSACPPDSPLRSFNQTNRFHNPEDFMRPAHKTFIADFRSSINACNTPELVHLSTMNRASGGSDLKRTPYPIFVISKSALFSDLLGCPNEDPFPEAPDEVPWAEKTNDRLLWRGSTTGMMFNSDSPGWNMSHRPRFVQLTNRKDGTVPVIPPSKTPFEDMAAPVEWELSKLNEFYMDTGFTSALQCDDLTCDIIRKNYTMKDTIYVDRGKYYKYVMDLDGNGWSARFRRLMARNSLVLKSTVYPEWWTDRAVPWVHYVPIKVDYGDLYDVLAYFRGLPDGTKGHEYLAEKIASAGRRWVEEFWRPEDVTAYTWRLYLEYFRVMSEDRASMDFVLDT